MTADLDLAVRLDEWLIVVDADCNWVCRKTDDEVGTLAALYAHLLQAINTSALLDNTSRRTYRLIQEAGHVAERLADLGDAGAPWAARARALQEAFESMWPNDWNNV